MTNSRLTKKVEAALRALSNEYYPKRLMGDDRFIQVGGHRVSFIDVYLAISAMAQHVDARHTKRSDSV